MRFFKLGETDSYTVIHFLYYTGFPIIVHKSIEFGKAMKVKAVLARMDIIPSNFNAEAFNSPFAIIKGLFLGTIYFIISMLIWRFICELLIILFRYFESNTKKSDL